jgi:hypothetical protein
MPDGIQAPAVLAWLGPKMVHKCNTTGSVQMCPQCAPGRVDSMHTHAHPTWVHASPPTASPCPPPLAPTQQNLSEATLLPLPDLCPVLSTASQKVCANARQLGVSVGRRPTASLDDLLTVMTKSARIGDNSGSVKVGLGQFWVSFGHHLGWGPSSSFTPEMYLILPELCPKSHGRIWHPYSGRLRGGFLIARNVSEIS